MSETTKTKPVKDSPEPKGKQAKRPTRSALSAAVSLLLCMGIFHPFYMPKYIAILQNMDNTLPGLTLGLTQIPGYFFLAITLLLAAGLLGKELAPSLDLKAKLRIDRIGLTLVGLLAGVYLLALLLPLIKLS